jgi:hypothetical protein
MVYLEAGAGGGVSTREARRQGRRQCPGLATCQTRRPRRNVKRRECQRRAVQEDMALQKTRVERKKSS